MDLLLISTDLMIQSRVAAAASRAGFAAPRVIDGRETSSLEGADACRLALVDLSSPDLEVKEVVAGLRAQLDATAPIIAFGPHVQKARLDAARDAGCDYVLSRGQLDRDIEAILQRLLDGSE